MTCECVWRVFCHLPHSDFNYIWEFKNPHKKLNKFPTVVLIKFFKLDKNIMQNSFVLCGCERVRAHHIQIKMIPRKLITDIFYFIMYRLKKNPQRGHYLINLFSVIKIVT